MSALRQLCVVILALSACGNAHPASKDPRVGTARFDAEAFHQLRARYMQALDDRASDPTAAAIEMEELMRSHAEAALAERSEDAGLALIYSALLMTRDLHLCQSGVIDRDKLFAAHRYSGQGDAGAETTARRKRARELLARAQEMRPNDGRIASWLAGADALAASGPDEALSDTGKSHLLAAIDVEPAFNLWTAFIALDHEPLGTETSNALFDKTKAFLATNPCRDPAPGSRDERNCRSGALAPFNSQAAIVMLGDQYLRHGEDALRRGAIPEAMPLLATAGGIYSTLRGDSLRDTTATWRDAASLDERLHRLESLEPGAPVPDDSFWSSRSHDAVYECASCHTK